MESKNTQKYKVIEFESGQTLVFAPDFKTAKKLLKRHLVETIGEPDTEDLNMLSVERIGIEYKDGGDYFTWDKKLFKENRKRFDEVVSGFLVEF